MSEVAKFVCLNGKMVREEEAMISASDRGFLYGDGLFETMRVAHGRPFCWDEHLDRLMHGAGVLGIQIPFVAAELREQATGVIEKNGIGDGVLRLVVSRGEGSRGYSPKLATKPSVLASVHPLPEKSAGVAGQWKAITSSVSLPGRSVLSAVKHSNRLPQILARMEADARGADEALLVNSKGELVEASSGNLLWIENGMVKGPSLEEGILPGVTREVVLGICRRLGIGYADGAVMPTSLRGKQGAFITQSVQGIVEIAALDGHSLGRSELLDRLAEEYTNLLDAG